MSEDQESRTDQEKRGSSTRNNLADLYDKMNRVMRENLERAGTLTEDAFERALKESRDWAGRMREHYAEDINKVSEFIRRDWHEGIKFMRNQTRRSLDLDRLQVGVLGVLANLARSAGAQLESFARGLQERLTYKTGEIAGAGTLQCVQCGQQLVFEKATRIPPCPKCHSTQFRRSY